MGLFDKLTHKNNDSTSSQPAQASTEPAPSNPWGKPAVGAGLLNLKKEVGVVLDKKNLSSTKAAVYGVLDYSGSMNRFYKDGSVQDFTEKMLAVAMSLDDDGTIPVVLFDSQARAPYEVTQGNYANAVKDMVAKAGHMGTTNYAAAMREVISHYKNSGSTAPALVIFQTDGSPDSRREAEQVLCEAASLPIFWQFVGFGNDSFDFLHKLDELEVPKKRMVDNAGFFTAGSDPKKVPAGELYENLLGEFPQWLQAAKTAGIISA